MGPVFVNHKWLQKMFHHKVPRTLRNTETGLLHRDVSQSEFVLQEGELTSFTPQSQH